MRSRSIPLRGAPADSTNAIANDGMAPRDIDPRIAGLTGTSRQPSSVRPSSMASASMRSLAAAASLSSIGRKAMPAA